MASELKLSFEFDRYVNGTLMAEGVTIERASTLDKAMVAAARIAPKGPNGETPVLVYRPAPAATDTGLVTVDGIVISKKFYDHLVALSGYYIARPSTPDHEFVNVCNGDIRMLNDFMDKIEHVVTVTRSQAEELLAAERAAQQRLLDIIEEANDDKEALEAKLAAAEQALEPLADIADLIDAETEGMAETDELVLHFHDYEFAKWPVSFFRKARAALGGKP